MKPVFILTLILGLLVIAACAPVDSPAPGDSWAYADLRSLSPAAAVDAGPDLVALYMRQARTDFQVRLDLFDLSAETRADIYLALDTRLGGTRRLPFDAQAGIDWDILIAIPQNGLPRAFSAVEQPGDADSASGAASFVELPGLIPRAARYPWLDSLVIAANASAVSREGWTLSLEAFALQPGDSIPADRIGPARSDGAAPGRAAVLLAFWDTFPAYMPAQALRRWDGAHTGPFGERHGLHVLLQNVRRYRIPVVLLDIKNLAWLSALDTVGGLPLVQDLARRGLVILPDAVYGSPSFPYFPEGLPDWTIGQAIQDSRAAGAQFGLPASKILYAPRWDERLPSGYQLIFTQSAPGEGFAVRGARWLPLPFSAGDLQAGDEGLSLEVRRQLLANAIASSDPGSQDRLVILGGSLPDSSFGDPRAAEAAFIYMAGHPWMLPLDANSLAGLSNDLAVDLPASLPAPALPDGEATFAALLAKLPPPSTDAPLALATWQSALSLFAALPPESSQLLALRSSYSGQVGALNVARQWAAAPQPVRECRADLDLDGLPECILASPDVFATFDLLGGRLTRLFVRTPSGTHQLVGPSNQFIVGLSDPSAYDLAAGEAADPTVISGGFADNPPPWPLYQATIEQNAIRFSSPDGALTKTFSLKPDGLSIEYHLPEPRSLQLPLALDPWQRDAPGWAKRYRLRQIDSGWAWGLQDGPAIEIRASLPTSVQPFNASLADLQRFENPNYDYPRGHYLPYPLALLEIQAAGDFSVEISLVE